MQGSVAFYYNGQFFNWAWLDQFGSVSVNAFNMCVMPPGSYNVVASYNPDPDNYYNDSGYFNLPASGSTTLIVQPGNPFMYMTTSGTPSELGQAVTFKAVFFYDNASGIVNFSVDGNWLGSGPINNNTASFITSALTTGTHTVTAAWAGDSNFGQGTASITQFVLTPTPTDPNSPIITSISPNLGSTGLAVTLTGHSFGASMGSITFNGIPASVSSWSPSSIVATVPGSATTGPVVIVTSGGVSSNGVLFRAPAPPNCPI
jgi:hypothetical protein